MPPVYPLQGQNPKYDLKLSNPNAKLSELWLQKEYQKLSLDQTRENRKRIRNGEDNFDDEEYDRDFTAESCDEMIISDTEVNTTQYSQNSVLRESTHPPKRRLMSVLSPVTALTPLFGHESSSHDVASPNSDTATTTTANNGTAAAATTNTAASTINNAAASAVHVGASGANSNSRSDMNGSNCDSIQTRTPGAMNSASNTPVSDIEEQPQQLPLPSPSASPIHSADKQDLSDPIESLMANVPNTQQDLIKLIQGLSSFLSERNQNHLIFKLLQSVNRSSLSSINDVVYNSLRRDFLSNLPAEITYNILSQLDHKSLFNASSVCKDWFKLLNNSNVWIDLLKKDHLMESTDEIERELANPQKLVEEWGNSGSKCNIEQLLYKKRSIIYKRWMDPTYEPKRISIRIPSQGNNVVTCLQHDDDKIITGVDDRLISVYSTKTGELLKVLKGHEGGVWALKYTGNTLISGSTDRTVRVWNIKTGKCTHIFRGHTSTVRCLDILHPVKIGKDDAGNDIIFPKEPLLVTGSRDHNLNVWKLPIIPEDDDEESEEGDQSDAAITHDSNDPNNPYLLAVLLGHTQSVRSVSAYGNLIVSGSYDATVRVWDILDNFSCKQVLTGHTDRIYSTVLDYENKVCYSGSMDSTVHVWNVETGELLHTLEGHASLVGLLELSKDYLVSAAADATLRVWDPKTGENYSKLEGHTAAITCFQHDPLRIVSGSERMLKLWDIRTGKFVKDILADVTGGIWQVRFDFNRCVAAVQRSINDREETFIEILDYSVPPPK